jgi:CHAD domain-containing protein
VASARQVRNLSCDEPFRSAAGKILWTRFDEMMSLREAALAGKDIEGVHDMRVASRRLRAALEAFRDVFPKSQFRPMLRDVKRLADALGTVRDLDVMLQRLQSDAQGRPEPEELVLREMAEEMQTQRTLARRELKATIDDLDRNEFPRQFLFTVAQETA